MISKIEAEGHIVPRHDMLKTPDEVEMIKKSAEINVAVLDEITEKIVSGEVSDAKTIGMTFLIKEFKARGKI